MTLNQMGPAADSRRNRTPITQETSPPMRPTHLAPAVTLAAILLHGTTAAAQTPEYLAPLENGGVQILGRTRNESCSVTTTIKSVDGRQHTVVVNQTPKWGPPTLTVPAGGQVTVVVNGDLVAPFILTVDGAVVIARPVPRVTPGGVDCGTDPTTTTVPPTSTTAPPELETVVIDDPLPPATVPPATTTTVVDPPTTTRPPAIELISTTPTLPETGAARARATAHLGASLLVVGAVLAASARKAKK